jgi:hypothetical protein
MIVFRCTQMLVATLLESRFKIHLRPALCVCPSFSYALGRLRLASINVRHPVFCQGMARRTSRKDDMMLSCMFDQSCRGHELVYLLYMCKRFEGASEHESQTG